MTKVAAVAPEVLDAGIWPLSEHFANGVSANLPQPVRRNKTASLVTPKGADADGN